MLTIDVPQTTSGTIVHAPYLFTKLLGIPTTYNRSSNRVRKPKNNAILWQRCSNHLFSTASEIYFQIAQIPHLLSKRQGSVAMNPNSIFKFFYLTIMIAAMLMALQQIQDAAYVQAMFALVIGAVCAYRLYRTLRQERT